ncbi:MAG TPA: lactate utilization protein [Candidatus Anaerostipes avistercoris]|uniref:Lactate utilization protein n=1 Tax=Candidatus Anaerostipes avistercoris TaxID=2838462 RepID=A0A9D2T958_9FIRM|nr:lactate utilization protein [uncultured Anaerostipes sp.]HJC49936.1 lactate utilization protein [Candidatus Anaerostipes avistercoris]
MSTAKANEIRANTIIRNLEKRNMEGVYCATREDALKQALSYMEKGSVVSWGGSMSIEEIGLMDAVRNGDYEIIDRDKAKDYDERREIFSKIVLSDYFLMSTNAITLDGELINIDGTGNRVGPLCFGPKHVIMIVGMNKVVSSVEDGVARVRNIAAPPNCIRLGLETPCSLTGRCADCYGDTCICSDIVVTRRQSAAMRGRIKVILVGENIGY